MASKKWNSVAKNLHIWCLLLFDYIAWQLSSAENKVWKINLNKILKLWHIEKTDVRNHRLKLFWQLIDYFFSIIAYLSMLIIITL